MSEEVKNFYKKFEIDVIDNNKRCIRRHSYAFFSEAKDKDLITNNEGYVSEPLLTLTIPASQLEHLQRIYSIVYNHRHLIGGGTSDVFQVVLDQVREERSLRQQYPALQEAYEHYSTLLHLTGYQKKIPL